MTRLGNRRAPVPVEIQTQLVAGQLADGDEVEVSGVWDGGTLDADTIVNFSSRSSSEATPVPGPRRNRRADKAPKGRRVRIVALVAVVGVIVLAAAAVL